MGGWLGRATAFIGITLVSAGCGLLPLPTTTVHHPPLPAPEPFPELTSEELVEMLEAEGLDCQFTPDSDIAGGWGCEIAMNEPWSAGITFTPETGQVVTMSASLSAAGEGPDPAADPPDPNEFDAMAAAVFHRYVTTPVFGEGGGPAVEELTTMVRNNAPQVVADDWLLHFGRNSILRTIGVRYHEPT